MIGQKTRRQAHELLLCMGSPCNALWTVGVAADRLGSSKSVAAFAGAAYDAVDHALRRHAVFGHEIAAALVADGWEPGDDPMLPEAQPTDEVIEEERSAFEDFDHFDHGGESGEE